MRINVTVVFDFEPDEKISDLEVIRSVEAAVRNAVKKGEMEGYDHPLADAGSLLLASGPQAVVATIDKI